MDSAEEARYRLSIAGEHLHRAIEEMENFKRDASRAHLVGCAAEAQLCIENSAKAVISVFRIPSREHDPSAELLDVLVEIRDKIGEELGRSLEELANIASKLAPEHIRATYGDETRRIPPSELYDEVTVKGFIDDAEKAQAIAERFLADWFRS